jgi:hypothetical protein
MRLIKVVRKESGMANNRLAGLQPDEMIRILEKDDHRFSEALTRDAIWHYLKRAQLTESQKKRLRAIALAALQQQIRKEFWKMCKLMHHIADEPFCAAVRRYMDWSDEKVRKRASLLYAYLQSLEAGAKARGELFHAHLRESWKTRHQASA